MGLALGKKKEYKFSVRITLDELSAVSYLTGRFVCKLTSDGECEQESQACELDKHTVLWDQDFHFVTRLTADPLTGLLDSSIIRISVLRVSVSIRVHDS